MPTTRSAYIVDQHEGLWSKRRLRKAFGMWFLLARYVYFRSSFSAGPLSHCRNEATDNITANQTITFVDE